MKAEYSPVSFNEMRHYLDILSKNDTRASDYSFANLWGWAPHYGLEWRYDGTLYWIRQTRPEPCYWAPVGPWEAVDNWLEKPEMRSGSTFIRVPHRLCKMWSVELEGAIKVEESRGQWDYIYRSSDLCTLAGKRYHSRRNQLTQFMKLYEHEYSQLSADHVETVLGMQADWCRWHDCHESEALLAENDAVARVLTHWGEIPGLCGGIIHINAAPVAYIVAEPLNPDTLILHFEKGANGIKGVYQAINHMFCNDVGKDFVYINKEQDLDDEGLRTAKLRYYPCGYAKKCQVDVL